MKKVSIVLCLIYFTCLCSSAQSLGALTIFSENGEKFYLILNGQKQNNVAQTNVRVDGLNQPNYTAKIIFDDKALPEISKNYLAIADADQKMMDVTYKIKHDKNGQLKLGNMPASFVPYQQNAAPAPDVYVVHYGQPDPAPVTTTVSQTTTTTTTANPNSTMNVNVNGMNMGVSVSDPNATAVETTTTRTTTTTSTTAPPAAASSGSRQAPGCKGVYPMLPGDFASALAAIKHESFEETKLSTAKQIGGGNCLSAEQITDVCKVFGFEETKLDFAKYAYGQCTDPQNYYKVNSVFSFSTNVEEMNRYTGK